MAESGADRTRRWRKHKAGDHSLCKHCPDALAPREGQDGPPPVRPVSDALGEMRRLAGRLVAAHEADPGNALIARELRMTLQALTGGQGHDDDDLERLFADLGAA